MRTLILILLALAVPAQAQVPPLQAFQEAKASGLLPAWVDVSDRVRLIPRWPTTAYLCIEDRQKPNRLTLVGSLDRLVEWYDTGLVSVPTTWGPALAADIQVCFPDYKPTAPPAPLVPKALGEPVYRAIAHLKAATPPYWRTDTPLDWSLMNSTYVARSSVAGEACGSLLLNLDGTPALSGSTDPAVGWYVVSGGMTRCKPQ